MTAPSTTERPAGRSPLTGTPARSPDTEDLPSRAALIARLEAQRDELLHAMACVNLARRTIEEHVLTPPPLLSAPSGHQHEINRHQVLEALGNAHRSLATAYPILERIAEGLNAVEILKEHRPESSRSGVVAAQSEISNRAAVPHRSPRVANP